MQIRDIASRYQIGPNADLKYIHENNGYGENVIKNKTNLIRALELNIKQGETSKDNDKKA